MSEMARLTDLLPTLWSDACERAESRVMNRLRDLHGEHRSMIASEIRCIVRSNAAMAPEQVMRLPSR